MISHATCNHPRTPKARQACRRARETGAETLAEARTIDMPTRRTGGGFRSVKARAGDPKRRLRNTIELLSRAIDQGHPKRVRVYISPADSVVGDVVEVCDQHIVLCDLDGLERSLRYGQIMSIGL